MIRRSAIEKWNERYREGHDDLPIPLPFFVDAVAELAPGRALDIACGLGRHSIYLAKRGWQVTAVDGSEVAIATLCNSAPEVRSLVEDIEAPGYTIPEGPYELIVDTFFLHRPLFPQIFEALVPGGLAVLAFHLEGTFSIALEEIDQLASGWEVVNKYLHKEAPTVELVLRKPLKS